MLPLVKNSNSTLKIFKDWKWVFSLKAQLSTFHDEKTWRISFKNLKSHGFRFRIHELEKEEEQERGEREGVGRLSKNVRPTKKVVCIFFYWYVLMLSSIIEFLCNSTPLTPSFWPLQRTSKEGYLTRGGDEISPWLELAQK